MRPGRVWLLGALTALAGCSLDYGKDAATPADQVPLMVFQNLRQTSVRDGRIEYTMETEGSEAYPARKQVRLKRFRFQEYDSQGQAASAGSADAAVIDTGTNDASIQGHLEVRSADQGVTLKADGANGLAWTNDDRILKTLPGTAVTMLKDDGSRIEANSMVLDLGSNALQLDGGVQGTWTAEANHDAKTPVPPPVAGSASPR